MIVTVTEYFTLCDHNMIMTHIIIAVELNNHVKTSSYRCIEPIDDVNNNNDDNKCTYYIVTN